MSEKAIAMFSGGAGSWGAAKRATEDFEDVTLLFADTLIEDEDLYRFVLQAGTNVTGHALPRPLERFAQSVQSVEGELPSMRNFVLRRLPDRVNEADLGLVWLAEGRDPWQVFFDGRFLGNTRIDPCSRVLKRDLMRKWLEENCDPKDTTVILGFDWSEAHRFERAKGYWEPWKVEAPLCERPYLSKEQVLGWLTEEGIEPPRLYSEGFKHNNCGGFCIKAGQAQFEHLLRTHPDRYRYHEGREQELRDYLDKDVAILRDRQGGELRPLTLRAFRKRLEAEPELFDAEEWGACSCMEAAA